MFVLMFVNDAGNFIFNIKKTFEEVKKYKDFKDCIDKNNNKAKQNFNNDNNESQDSLFSISEIHLMDSIKQNYHIRIFTCFNENKTNDNKNNENNYSSKWNLLITLTLKNSETEQKLEHLERWLFHFLT